MLTLFFASASSVPGVYYAYQHSDAVGKFIVILLLIGSILTWTVMLDKAWSLYRARRLSARFINMFQLDGENNMLALSILREAENNSGPAAAIYRAGVENCLIFMLRTMFQAIPAVFQNPANSLKPNTMPSKLFWSGRCLHS